MRRLHLSALPLLLAVAACGAQVGSPYPLPDGGSALRWGDGPYGVVLVAEEGREAASWDAQARAIADERITVVALQDADATLIREAILALRDDGVERVAVLAAGSATGPALELGTQEPELVDQLILLTAGGDVSRLGVFPKLFVASQADAAETERMAAEAPGDWNAVFFVPGDARGQAILEGEARGEALDAILQRLEERR
ncbi:MAG TPA: alpha/beta hydrolase [Candidatus Limnocylindria bacterium]|nr:alpha/beta hydrolase [Candidatus Limnocylindria bacterium]